MGIDHLRTQFCIHIYIYRTYIKTIIYIYRYTLYIYIYIHIQYIYIACARVSKHSCSVIPGSWSSVNIAMWFSPDMSITFRGFPMGFSTSKRLPQGNQPATPTEKAVSLASKAPQDLAERGVCNRRFSLYSLCVFLAFCGYPLVN